MTEATAKTFFAPYYDWIISAYQQGWESYHKTLMHPMDDTRARATMIQNRAIIYAALSAPSFPSIHVFEFDSRRLFRVADKAIVHFKKVDEELLASNNSTKKAAAFAEQQFLNGLEDLPRITAAYQPNANHTGYTLHLLHTKSLKANNWDFSIDSAQGLIQLLDLSDAPNDQPRRVRAKGSGDNADTGDATTAS